MLYSSIGKEYNTVSGKYVYCSRYKNGENLLLLRNPHVCSSNFYIATNEYNSELAKYFNLNSNILIVNSKSNIMDRLSGCDFDGDTALVTKINHAFDADTYFPSLDQDDEWQMTKISEEQTCFDLEYYFTVYERVQK